MSLRAEVDRSQLAQASSYLVIQWIRLKSL